MPVIKLVDVTVRDALQRIAAFIPTDRKAALARMLAEAGFERLEVTSFRPDRPRQFSDGADLLRSLAAVEGPAWRALCYHADGVKEALDAGAREIALNVGTLDGFEQRFGRTVDDALGEALRGLEMARAAGVPCLASLSHGLGAVYDQAAHDRLGRVLDPLVAAGIDGCTLADTGGACAKEAGWIFYCAVATRYPDLPVAMHFHEGVGTALDNVSEAVISGCSRFETGLSPARKPIPLDNASPLDVAHLLETMGLPTGLDAAALEEARGLLSGLAGLEPIME